MDLARSLTVVSLAAMIAGCAPSALWAQDPAPAADPSGGITVASILAIGTEVLAGDVPVYHSSGFSHRAAELQALIESGRHFFQDSLGLRAHVNLAVLSQADWSRLTDVPYTIPFYSAGEAVIFLPATTAGPIVDDYLSNQPRLPAARLARIRDAGFDFEDGAHAMVDLIGYHELGHLYTRAYGIQPPSPWMHEFLATYFAYAYLRRTQPHLAELWDGMVAAPPDARPPHTSLADFDRLYFGVGPENYFWYQGVFATRVTEVFDRHGLGFLSAVRESFPASDNGTQPPPAYSSDEVFAALERIDPGFMAWAERLETEGRDDTPGSRP
jgi:hypothetical protein